MPLSDLHVIKGVLTPDEKARIITETAEAFGRVAGEKMVDARSVGVPEVPSGARGRAHGVWTTDRALALKAGGDPA